MRDMQCEVRSAAKCGGVGVCWYEGECVMALRREFGLESLDWALGGGLLPGTLTVIAGATGVGKTQVGLQWANRGEIGDGHRGIICDLTSRGDAQNHIAYARDLFGWALREHPLSDTIPNLDQVWDDAWSPGDYFHPFHRAGRRVTRPDLDPEEWHGWKSDLARVLRHCAHWLYSHGVRGARRVVVDGIEPTDRFSESIQFEFFEYLYHKLIRQDDDWLARELFRERFRSMEAQVASRRYDAHQVGCLYLYTTPHVLLDDLMAQPITAGDIFANANTIILMGRIRQTSGYGRALYVAKHRGSACSDDIHPYALTDRGLVFS